MYSGTPIMIFSTSSIGDSNAPQITAVISRKKEEIAKIMVAIAAKIPAMIVNGYSMTSIIRSRIPGLMLIIMDN